MFPTEAAARKWFEGIVWPNGNRHCPRCAGLGTYRCKHAKMPYRCRDCGKYFSVKTGTVMAGSPLPLRKWAYAIYLDMSSPKGVSSTRLRHDIGVTQKTAWFMQHRIRQAFVRVRPDRFEGPVEVDEAYIGGKERNKHASKRVPRKGWTGKIPVVGLKDRATNTVSAYVVKNTDSITLWRIITAHIGPGSVIYTDEYPAYSRLTPSYRHRAAKHSTGEYVRGDVHTNGMESFWALLKPGLQGNVSCPEPEASAALRGRAGGQAEPSAARHPGEDAGGRRSHGGQTSHLPGAGVRSGHGPLPRCPIRLIRSRTSGSVGEATARAASETRAPR